MLDANIASDYGKLMGLASEKERMDAIERVDVVKLS